MFSLQSPHRVLQAALFIWVLTMLLSCAPQAPKPSPGHLQTEKSVPVADIPPPVTHVPYIPPPDIAEEPELYTVVVDNVPVRPLLFSLARDAKLNIDIHPGIKGVVTLNALEQTLMQILQRVARQVSIRYQLEETYLTIMPDTPHIRYYQIAYVNLDRTTTNSISVQTQVASGEGGGDSSAFGGGNDSSTQISSTTKHNFWEALEKNVSAILSDGNTDTEKTVIAHRESGLLTVRATARQHEQVQRFLDQMLTSVHRQVLIEATIAEIRLKDRYQAGVDWRRLDGDYTYGQTVLGGNFSGDSGYYFGYADPTSIIGNISAALQLLEEFGSVKVLSSPKLLALNNQPAILKVVDNRVYFTVDVERTESTENTTVRESFTTEVRTVPEGLIINVIPQISEDDTIILNIRPTISRIIDFVNDPNPALTIANRIPEVQVREIESVLKVRSGQVAIIGGLMQDSNEKDKIGVPILKDLPMVGDLFSYRRDEFRKIELAIFLRPVVIRDASLITDMRPYKVFLPDSGVDDPPPITGLPLNPEAYYERMVPDESDPQN